MTDTVFTLMKRLAGKYACLDRLCEFDDMLSVALIAAWRSEATYRPGAGCSPGRWAYLKGNSAILMMRRRERLNRSRIQELSFEDMAQSLLATRDFVPFLLEVLI